VIPVTIGIARSGVPPALVGAGMVVAIAGVAMASRERDEARHGISRRALALALLATVMVGLQLAALGEAADAGGPLWGVVALRVVCATIFGVALLARRGPAPTRSDLLALAPLGIVDTGANVAFALAVAHGDLALAAVLGSLYPVVTVAFARVVLGERLQRDQTIGAALAIAGALVVVGAG
jgi:drug/metabolite transporter (DMT)-like permease